MNVSAVIVTRGDVDMSPILESLPFDEIIVWDNSQREDLGLYGRYAAIAETSCDVIYTQDDDLLVPRAAEVAAAYQPDVLTVNWQMAYDIAFPGRGSVFHRDLPGQVFARYLERYPFDRWFTHYGCDGIFSLLANRRVIDVGHENLPHAFNEGRLSTSPDWFNEKRLLIPERARELAAC